MLATFGAISIAAYLLIGRTLRNTIDLKTYLLLTYGFATVTLALYRLCGEEDSISSLSTTAWFYVLSLALGPQLIGHTILNWGVRRFSATIVSMAVLAEPIAASLLAWIIFDEIVEPGGFIGFTGILLGIVIVIHNKPLFAILTNRSRDNPKSM
jgi:drug/metabolite transporter (DMT)-like permease